MRRRAAAETLSVVFSSLLPEVSPRSLHNSAQATVVLASTSYFTHSLVVSPRPHQFFILSERLEPQLVGLQGWVPPLVGNPTPISLHFHRNLRPESPVVINSSAACPSSLCSFYKL